MRRLTFILAIAMSAILFMQCDKNNEIHVIGIAQDKELGRQVDSSIIANPAEYPILERSTHEAAYKYIEAIRDRILASGKVAYKDDFPWSVKIIKKDDIQNAFATPGGYIYVYSGLIKYLEKEDDLAGVLGHEIAHADQRHSIKQMEKQYGASVLLSILLGKDANQLATIIATIATQGTFLAFSRAHETEADSYSVKYLSGTSYVCNGAAHFFEMIEAEGQSSPPEFLSTHPNPGNRIENINKEATELKCNTSTPIGSNYELIKQSVD